MYIEFLSLIYEEIMFQFFLECLKHQVYQKIVILFMYAFFFLFRTLQTGEPSLRLACGLCVVVAWVIVSAAQDYHYES